VLVDHPDVLNGEEEVGVILLGTERSWPSSFLGTILKSIENLGGGPGLSGSARDSVAKPAPISMIVSIGAFTVATCILSAPALKRYGPGGTLAADRDGGRVRTPEEEYIRGYFWIWHT